MIDRDIRKQTEALESLSREIKQLNKTMSDVTKQMAAVVRALQPPSGVVATHHWEKNMSEEDLYANAMRAYGVQHDFPKEDVPDGSQR